MTDVTVMCTASGCNSPAEVTYVWEWGESGAACGKHKYLLQQKSRQLRRSIQFSPISPGMAPPVEREERVHLQAKALAAEEEARVVTERSKELYNSNRKLIEERRRIAAQLAHLEGELRTTGAEIVRLREENAEYKSQLAMQDRELQELRELLGPMREEVDSRVGP